MSKLCTEFLRGIDGIYYTQHQSTRHTVYCNNRQEQVAPHGPHRVPPGRHPQGLVQQQRLREYHSSEAHRRRKRWQKKSPLCETQMTRQFFIVRVGPGHPPAILIFFILHLYRMRIYTSID